jgi:hypothetical protein
MSCLTFICPVRSAYRQLGFVRIDIPLWAWGALAFVLVLLFGGIQTHRLKNSNEKHRAYVAKVEAEGRSAKKEADRQAAADLKNKERADDEAKRTAAAHQRELTRLRANLASRSFVPPTSPLTGGPDEATYDRAELDRALRGFAGRAGELIGEGKEAIDGLNTAKRWRQ